jgi:SAM-dependent methyltransferase
VTTYTFGDDAIAAERLLVLDEVFAPTTDGLLGALDVAPQSVLDLGCGPGATTARLVARFPDARVTGLDASVEFLARARRTVPGAAFTVADVTAPLPGGPHDVVYARFLLAHLPDVAAALAGWGAALAPGGVVVLEETESIATDDADFARYLEVTATRVDGAGARLYAGPLVVDALPPDLRRLRDEVRRVDVTVGQAAAMFWRNLASWGHTAVADGLLTEPERATLLERLRSRADDPTRGCFDWRHRQVVARRR